MKLAILSDIHGNAIALDAVLADIEAQGGVDGYWVLGDIVSLGPDPAQVAARLDVLPGLEATYGNTDDYTRKIGLFPFPGREDVEEDISLLSLFEEVVSSFSWTRGAITATGWLDWLNALPLDARRTLPDGTRVLGVHAAPGTAHGDGIRPDYDAEQLSRAVAGCEADLVFVGHTHWYWDTVIDGVRVVNLGSVSNPLTPDMRASYVILEAGEDGYEVTRRRAAYDVAACMARIDEVAHPACGFMKSFFRGEMQSPLVGKYQY